VSGPYLFLPREGEGGNAIEQRHVRIQLRSQSAGFISFCAAQSPVEAQATRNPQAPCFSLISFADRPTVPRNVGGIKRCRAERKLVA